MNYLQGITNGYCDDARGIAKAPISI